MTRLSQVRAHVLLGDIAAADRCLAPVLETEEPHRVDPLRRRASDLHQVIRTRHDSGPGLALADEVRALTASLVPLE